MAAISKQALDAKRDGYDRELASNRFHLDSYTGGGGYQGRIQQDTAGFWGIASQTYTTFATLAGKGEEKTYLDQFPREDEKKFQRRKDVAHYLNYVKPTTLLKVGYVCRKPHKRNNVPDKVQQWIDRTGYDKDFRRRAVVTAVLGWFPMLVDMPQAVRGAVTAQQEGDIDPYVTLSLPCHLYDYQLDESGALEWAKTVVTFKRKATWEDEAQQVTRYTVWTRTEWLVIECVGEAVGDPKTGTHKFGKVPIVSWRADVSVEDAIKAESVNASIAVEARRLFNLVSELDEHIRAQVFALLVWPGNNPTNNKTGQAGVSDGLIVDRDAKHMPAFLAPPPSVAATLEARILATVVEMFRIAGVEYERASGVRSSAQSKENEFEKTNVGIVSLAQALARADLETLTLVGRGLDCSEDELAKMECVAHESYADAALSDELEQVIEALASLPIGRTAKIELLKRLVQKLLPGLTSDTKATIDSEIEGAVDQAEKEREALAMAALEPDNDNGEPGKGKPPADEEDDEEAA